jgi:hypothetical protein
MTENYTVVQLDFTFKYFEREYSQLSISSNGYVCFGENADCENFERPVPHDILVGFNCHLDTTRTESGQIYYKDLDSNSVDFKSSKIYLNLFDPDFEPSKIFTITYDNVLTSISNGFSTARVSFQIILSYSDSFKKTFIIFKYTSCPKEITLRASSGLNLVKNDGNLQEVKILDGQQCTGSNVDQKGVWVSDVTLKNNSKSIF